MLPPFLTPGGPGAKKAPAKTAAKAPKMGVPTKTVRKTVKKSPAKGC